MTRARIAGTGVVVAALTWAVTVPLAAQAAPAGPPLTLPEAATRALASHPSARVAAARREGAAAGLGEQQAARLPSLVLSGSATAYSDPMLVAPLHGLTPSTEPAFDDALLQGAATASYTLFDGGARGARVRQARAELGAGEAAELGVTQALLSRVAAAYLDVLARRRVLAAHDQRLEALRLERSRVEQRHAAGRAAVLELRRAEAALADAIADRVRQQAALDVAEQDLLRLVGGRAPGVGPLADVALRETALPDRGAVTAAAVGTSPAVEEARQRLAAADAQVAVMRGIRWPELKAIGAYVQRGGGSSDFTDEWNAGLQLSYPLFTGGAAGKRVARADAARRAAAGDLELATLRVEEQVDRALAELAEAAARTASLREAVAAHEAVAAAERLRLEAGAGIQADYLAAEADLLGARAELARTDYRRIAARIETARLMGQLDLAWLTASLESHP